jgi:hypothetical protein
MTVKKSRFITDDGKPDSSMIKIANPWNYPGQGREFLPDKITNYANEEQLQRQREKRIERMERKGYIAIEDENDVLEVFKHKSNGKLDLLYEGRVIFFIWKYSQVLRVIDDEDERRLYLEGLNEGERALIMQHLIACNVIKMANFINDFGKFEVSRNNQLEARKPNGDVVWISNGSTSHTRKMNIELEDLSLATIKRAIEELNIDFPRTPKPQPKTKSKK